MEESILKVERLSHRYSVQWAVRDISLEISKNGIYGLLGSNGAGKSTMMNIICGVLKQTEGSVHIKGINMRENPVAAKRHIGFLPQQPPLQMDLTVEEYLEYCSFMRDVPSKEVNKAIDKALDRCGISHFRKRVIHNLSGGYQQRVGIAQADEWSGSQPNRRGTPLNQGYCPRSYSNSFHTYFTGSTGHM